MTDAIKVPYDVAARMHNLEVPYRVHLDDEGNEEWLYLVHAAGRDEEGVYQVVTEGPAMGERVYIESD